MSEGNFEHKLAWFKENEKPEAVLLVADDSKKISVVVAWSNMAVGTSLLKGPSRTNRKAKHGIGYGNRLISQWRNLSQKALCRNTR